MGAFIDIKDEEVKSVLKFAKAIKKLEEIEWLQLRKENETVARHLERKCNRTRFKTFTALCEARIANRKAYQKGDGLGLPGTTKASSNSLIRSSVQPLSQPPQLKRWSHLISSQ